MWNDVQGIADEVSAARGAHPRRSTRTHPPSSLVLRVIDFRTKKAMAFELAGCRRLNLRQIRTRAPMPIATTLVPILASATVDPRHCEIQQLCY